MIFGVHTILYSKKAEAVRAFFRDVLRFPSVDAGGGWLIFAAPPGEIGIHPAETHVHREQLYLMCTDVKAEVARLEQRASSSPRRSPNRMGPGDINSSCPMARDSASTSPRTRWRYGSAVEHERQAKSSGKEKGVRSRSGTSSSERRKFPKLTRFLPGVGAGVAEDSGRWGHRREEAPGGPARRLPVRPSSARDAGSCRSR